MSIPSNFTAFANQIYRFLDVTGDGTGSTDGAVKADVTPVDLKIVPPSTEVFLLNRMIVNIQCGSVLATQKYGDQAALTNGVKIFHKSDGVESEMPFGGIKSHDDWAGVCHDAVALNYGNVAGKSISIRWSFFKSGNGIWLDGGKAEEFIVRLSDDLSGLTSQRFQIQGQIFKK